MSSQLKEKKEQQQPLKREERADFLFNQHIVRTVAYTAAGFGVGMLASLLFKHKAGMTLFFAGTGAGYGGANFVNDLTAFRRNRNLSSPTQIQGQNIDQRRFERRDDDKSFNLRQTKEDVKQGAEELSSYMAGKVNQAARGVDEAGRNITEKAKKEFSRGGDDDSKEKKESSPVKEKANQAAKGVAETGRNLAEKAKKEFSRGGSDDSKEKRESSSSNSSKDKEKQESGNISKSGSSESGHRSDYQQGRNKATDPKEIEKRRNVARLEQERGGVDSIDKAANVRLPNDPSDPAFYGKKTDIATFPVKNKMEAGDARDKRG